VLRIVELQGPYLVAALGDRRSAIRAQRAKSVRSLALVASRMRCGYRIQIGHGHRPFSVQSEQTRNIPTTTQGAKKTFGIEEPKVTEVLPGLS